MSELKVEVLNGSGVSQNLQKVVDQLKSNGFNVTRTGSTNNTAKTVIMNKKEISKIYSIIENFYHNNINLNYIKKNDLEIFIIAYYQR